MIWTNIFFISALDKSPERSTVEDEEDDEDDEDDEVDEDPDPDAFSFPFALSGFLRLTFFFHILQHLSQDSTATEEIFISTDVSDTCIFEQVTEQEIQDRHIVLT